MTEKLRSELSEINEQIKALDDRRDEINQRLYELEDLLRLKGLVGKYFMFDNTESHHTAPRWAYLYVRGVSPRGLPERGQHTVFVDRISVYEEDGEAMAKLQYNLPYFESMLEHPCTQAEWQEALRQARKVFERLGGGKS